MQFSTSVIMAAAALLSSANAHMHLLTPASFSYGAPGANNGPVEASGANFPCKNPNYSDRSTETSMAVGSQQKLSFMGTAVHGGGSCQVSLSSDLSPTKDSKWLVIHSIEGGCPGQDPQAPNQNLGVPASAQNVAPNSGLHEYQFTIPEGIAPGQYVLAWSWVNKIGNREFYMECAPVKVTGGSATKRSPSDRRRRAELEKRADTEFPEMFTANIGNGCSTTEGVDVVYPNPGKSLEKGTLSMNFGPPVGTCGSASAPAPAGGSAPAPAPAAPSSTLASAPNPTGGVFHEPPAPAASSPIATPVPVPAPAPVSPPASPPASAPAPAPAPAGGATGQQKGACTAEGTWNCIGGTSFQRCASGQWSVVMNMAAGTSCKPGQSTDFAMLVKRDAKFSPEHLAMHRRSFSS